MNTDRACPDCGSPSRRNPCWYYIDNPKSGGDAPCTEYQGYDRRILRRRRHKLLWGVLFLALILAAFAAVIFFPRMTPLYARGAPTTIAQCFDFTELADVEPRIGGWSIWITWNHRFPVWVEYPDENRDPGWPMTARPTGLVICGGGGNWRAVRGKHKRT